MDNVQKHNTCIKVIFPVLSWVNSEIKPSEMCSMVDRYQHFAAAFCLHTIRMVEMDFSKTLVQLYHTTQRHIS
jgi:hypothetical protein